ncbi:MAG: DMT family transporter [Betaproteobacteria bacterium]|jgi:drug/metabolite transporter (DMT)-like permease
MNGSSLARLLLLAAIWGGSFLFMRIAAPVLGPTLLIGLRVSTAAAFLLAIALLRRRSLQFASHWKHYLVLGLCNSALPFLLFAYAAQTLTASLLSILNATAPIFGAVTTAAWNRSRLSPRTIAGLILGVTGVVVLVGLDPATLAPGAGVAIAAGLAASLCYGIVSTYAKAARQGDAFNNAHGSMWAATLIVLPAVPFFPAVAAATPGVLGAALALGIVCSGVAYLLYFRLIADLGPASALTVTFLIPVFGVLWGWLFLGEQVGLSTVAGSLIVIVGTALVTGFSPSGLFARGLAPR